MYLSLLIITFFIGFAENKIESCMLGVVLFDDSKTGENIADTLKHICDQWEITENKVLMVVTDQGANIMKGVKLLFGSKRHIPCFGHIINLVASKSVPIYKQPYTARLEPVIDEEEDDSEYIDPDSDSQFYEVISVIKKLKLIIKFFKSSETASRMLREQQMTEGRKEGHRLVLMLDVRTRWNSILSMVERFILLTNHVSTVLLSLPKSPPMLSGQELGILKELIKVLKPLDKVTVEMSGESYCTLSKVIPLVRLLKLVRNSLLTSPISSCMFCHFQFASMCLKSHSYFTWCKHVFANT